MSQNKTTKTRPDVSAYAGIIRLSPDIWYIISAIAQLERDLIAERVKNGLAAARARGKIIGRTRKRNSVLIESLLDAGLSYREIAKIAKCSHGSVHAQVVEYRAKKAKLKAAELESKVFTEIASSTQVLENVDIVNARDVTPPSLPPSGVVAVDFSSTGNSQTA